MAPRKRTRDEDVEDVEEEIIEVDEASSSLRPQDSVCFFHLILARAALTLYDSEKTSSHIY